MTTKTSPSTVTRRSLRGTTLAMTAAVVLAGVGVAGAATHSSAADSPAGSAARDDQMREVARHVLAVGVPGYVARIDNGRRVTTTVAGVADRTTGRALTARDQFEIGSNTKTFMATLALQQVDRGTLDLDAPVEKYLPGVVPDGRNITVRMLLNHTSGLFSYTGDPGFFTDMERDPQHVHTERELLDLAFAHKPNFAPGKGWSYSNTNYTLIGMILQKQTGRSLPELVQQRIAGPLGLKRTYFADPRATRTGPGYAHGYAVTFAGSEPVYTDISDRPLGGWGGAAGAIISTPDELSRFFAALVEGKLFSGKQLHQMKSTVEIPASFGVKGGYGLGLMKIDSACGTVWGHGGDTMGHHSTAMTTDDGRRTAVSDATAEPADGPNPAAERYAEVVFASDAAAVCRMLDRPIPADVTKALQGTTPASPTAAK